MAPALAARASDTRLANSELRILALGRLAVRPGERRADQATMNGTVVVKRSSNLLHIRGRRLLSGRRRRIDRLDRFGSSDCRVLRDDYGFVFDGSQAACGVRGITRPDPALLAALRRHAGLFVRMIGIARRAPGLLHFIVNHRHDGVICDAALPRAIVVENVTEPRPALLH
jgi:hypothetical protein